MNDLLKMLTNAHIMQSVDWNIFKKPTKRNSFFIGDADANGKTPVYLRMNGQVYLYTFNISGRFLGMEMYHAEEGTPAQEAVTV